MNEPVPAYNIGNTVIYMGQSCVVLKISTYCSCCDRFLAEARYSVAMQNGAVHHKVRECNLSDITE